MEPQINEAEGKLAPLKKVTPLSKYLAMILFVMLPFVGGWIGYKYAQNAQSLTPMFPELTVLPNETNLITEEEKEALDRTIHIVPYRFTSNKMNTSLTIPAGWGMVEITDVTLPSGATSSLFLIKEPMTGCVIASGKLKYYKAGHEGDPSFAILKPVSIADRIFSDTTQFDGLWLIDASREDVASTRDRLDTPRKYIPGEVRYSYGDIESFFLWQNDGLSVPDSCNLAMNSLLQSLHRYYEQTTLFKTSEGSLWIRHDGDNVGREDPRKTWGDSMTHLLLTVPSGEVFKVLELSNDTLWSGPTYVFKDYLFLPKNSQWENGAESSILAIDPFVGSIKSIPGTESKNSYISTLFIHDDTIYYRKVDTQFARCDFYSTCEGELYKVKITGGESILLAKGVLGEEILGYSKTENALYLSWGNGDGGCFARLISRFDLTYNTEKIVVEESRCEGDPVSDTILTTIQSVNDDLLSIPISGAVEIKNGKLVPSDLKPDNGYAQFKFVNSETF